VGSRKKRNPQAVPRVMIGMPKEEKIEFPESAGLMILPWVSLFPGGLLPLRIFEERYRHMLSDAIAGQRMFAIAHLDEDDASGEVDWNPIGTLGVLRACVTNEDGTSNLILQGVCRVEFSNHCLDPYPHADIEIRRDPEETSPEIEELRAGILQLVKKPGSGRPNIPPGFLDHLATIESPASFSDMVASTMVTNPVHRRQLIAESDITCRLELLAACLMDQTPIDLEAGGGEG
jgi:Lon protease-like protein